MSDIELVIKIPEEKLNIIKDKTYCGIYDPDLYKAIANGVPLPKGHGRLIDAYDMKDIEFINKGNYNSTRTIREWIDSAPTIIEADKAESEE